MEKEKKVADEINIFRILSLEDVDRIIESLETTEQLTMYYANVHEIIGKTSALFTLDLKKYFNIKSPNFIRLNYSKDSAILKEEDEIVSEALVREHKAYFLLQFWLPVFSNIVLLHEGYYRSFKTIYNLDFPGQTEVTKSIYSMRCFLLLLVRHDLFPPQRVS